MSARQHARPRPTAMTPAPVTAAEQPEDPGWKTGALCAQVDPEVFFPERGGSTRDAKRICAACEVRADCLRYAFHHDIRIGVWGGLSGRERDRLRSNPRRPGPKPAS